MAEHRTYGQWSFNAGELSPRMLGRVDQNVYANGSATMLGWLPLLQGPMTAAPGTTYVETAKGPCRLFPFESIVTQGYVIEATAGTFRFYTNDARIETAPGVAYEVAHPWTLDELWQLDYWQSNDVLYLVGAGKKPKKLERTGAVTFQLVDLDLTEGPIDVGNSDETIIVTTNGTINDINVYCGSPIFAATDVGRFFEIVATDFNNVPSWEPGMPIAVGNQRQWGGRVYIATASVGRTGGNPPEHSEGVAWDGSGGTDINGKGPYGVEWQYQYNAFGLVKITGFTNTNQVAAHVVNRLAETVTIGGSWRWSFGAFSDTSGWPETVGGWNDCLVLTRGNRVWTSVIDDFENFGRRDPSGDFQRDLSGGFTLPKPASVQWQASDRLLLLGSATDEYTVERVQIQTGTPGPPVFEIKLQSSYGSAKGKPIQADGRILFLQRAGRKLREFGYALQSDRYVAPDMTRLADHIGVPGFIELAWQAEPERFAWACRDDGLLACMTYDPQEQVMGWARRQLGGGMAALSICRITAPDGKLDQLWIAASLGDATLILKMAPMWQFGDDQKGAILSDAALSYDGPPDASFAGLDHLEGQTVDILADGMPHPQRQVTGGTVTLDYPTSHVHIGLPFPAVWTSLPPEVGQAEGTARGKIKRIEDVCLHVVEAQGIRVTVQDCDPILIETRADDAPQDQAVPLYTGLLTVPTIGTYDRLGQVTVERYQPTPATIIALVPTLEVADG